ncbi:MAG: WYL domain-containing protein [Lentisphaerae bacterium]|nr:WYL domain-containing protein [Lentisphaerota bacterium]
MSHIHQTVLAGTYPTAGRLARDIEVSERTILRDVAYMRDMLGAPLEYHRARRGYYYSRPGYAVPSVTVSEGELLSLMVACRALKQYEGTRYEADLRRAFAKIQALLPDPVSLHIGELAGTMSFAQTAPRPADAEQYRQLFRAVSEHRQIRVRYRSLGRSAAAERTLDPYHMACVDGAWYVIAYCHSRCAVRMFVPERMSQLRETGLSFAVPADFKYETYMAGAFQVLRGAGRQAVRLRFEGPLARYVAERRWHSTQVIRQTPDGSRCDVALTVGHLGEVAAWVQSFGGACRVLAPVALRRLVCDGHQAGWKANGGGGIRC